MADETPEQTRFVTRRGGVTSRWRAISAWYRSKWRDSRLFRLANYLLGAVLLGWFVLRQWILPARDPDYDRAIAEGQAEGEF